MSLFTTTACMTSVTASSAIITVGFSLEGQATKVFLWHIMLLLILFVRLGSQDGFVCWTMILPYPKTSCKECLNILRRIILRISYFLYCGRVGKSFPLAESSEIIVISVLSKNA